tara:strand:- start:383 stop:709 length:327 start_codon:yes stop_codon:yes gene_type:complete
MTTLYNKTALKKIKKDDLIQMFLDQQAKMNDCEIENQDLKEDNERLVKQRKLDIQRMMKGDEYKKELKELKESARIQWQRADKYYERIKELTEENEKLKDNVMDEYGD